MRYGDCPCNGREKEVLSPLEVSAPNETLGFAYGYVRKHAEVLKRFTYEIKILFLLPVLYHKL